MRRSRIIAAGEGGEPRRPSALRARGALEEELERDGAKFIQLDARPAHGGARARVLRGEHARARDAHEDVIRADIAGRHAAEASVGTEVSDANAERLERRVLAHPTLQVSASVIVRHPCAPTRRPARPDAPSRSKRRALSARRHPEPPRHDARHRVKRASRAVVHERPVIGVAPRDIHVSLPRRRTWRRGARADERGFRFSVRPPLGTPRRARWRPRRASRPRASRPRPRRRRRPPPTALPGATTPLFSLAVARPAVAHRSSSPPWRAWATTAFAARSL